MLIIQLSLKNDLDLSKVFASSLKFNKCIRYRFLLGSSINKVFLHFSYIILGYQGASRPSSHILYQAIRALRVHLLIYYTIGYPGALHPSSHILYYRLSSCFASIFSYILLGYQGASRPSSQILYQTIRVLRVHLLIYYTWLSGCFTSIFSYIINSDQKPILEIPKTE